MIRIGIWGTGSIAHRIMADFRRASNIELCAIASRSIEKAEAFQKQYKIPTALSGLKALCEYDGIDAVYVASPNPFHAQDAKLLLESGKHVICEKPFTINESEAEMLIQCAKKHNCFLMEAMWSRFMPAMRDLKARVDAGAIGEIRLITANFGFSLPFDENSRIYNMQLGGGALLDVGIYALSFASLFLGPDASVQAANCVKAPTGTDSSTAMQLVWPTGACAQLFCAVDAQTESRAMIYGTKGYAEIPDFWHASRYSITAGSETKTFSFEKENEGHYHQFQHAAEMMEKGETESDIMPLWETAAIVRLMTEIRRRLEISYPEEQNHAKA